jgi:hypothetical protein
MDYRKNNPPSSLQQTKRGKPVKNRTRSSFLLVFVFFLSSIVSAQPEIPDSIYVRENYTKKEYMIPMRDGVQLFTAVYIPKDTTTLPPIIMMRTPYSCAPYGEDGYPRFYGEQDS